jgi:hypothetical protein
MSTLDNLQVDPARRHKEDGGTCECGGTLYENHDNFACRSCKRVDWDNHDLPRTGVFIRAKYKDRWGDYDIAELDDESLAAYVNLRLDDAGKLRLIHILLGRTS